MSYFELTSCALHFLEEGLRDGKYTYAATICVQPEQ